MNRKITSLQTCYIEHTVSSCLIKRIFWFYFCCLPYAHCRLSYVPPIAVQSFGAVAAIEKAGEAIKVLGFHD